MAAPPQILAGRVSQVMLLATAVVVGLIAGGKPGYGVAAALGLAFVAVVLSNLMVGLCAFTIVTFLDVLQSGGSVSLTKAAGLLLALSWAVALISRGRRSKGFAAAYPGFAYVLALFLVWAALSYVWADSHSAVTTGWSRYALNLFLIPIVYAAVRERRHVLWVMIAFVVAASLSAGYGIVSPGGTTAEASLARATGTIGDANELAAVLVVGFVMALSLAVAVKRAPLARIAAASGAAICVYGIFLTLSRGGLIALGFALFASIFLSGRWRPLAAVAAVSMTVLALGYFEFVASPSARARVTTTQGGSGRTDIWTVGWRMVQAHPLTGVGVNNFQTQSIHYLLQPGATQRADLIIQSPKIAHNTYLEVLAELGIIGLALFLAILGWALWCLLSAARLFGRHGDLRMELFTRALMIALLGNLAADFFISNEFSKQLWLLLGLCPAILAIARTSHVGSTPDESSFQPRLRWSKAPALTAPEPVTS